MQQAQTERMNAMYDPINQAPSGLAAPHIKARHSEGATRAGWWILPSALLGSLGWVSIFYLIFG